MSENMKLWDSVCETDPAITKKMTHGAKLTAVDAQSQIKRATELWGPYGDTWKVDDLSYIHYESEAGPGVSLVGVFRYPGGLFPIGADMPYSPKDDCYKKLLTNLTTKALSKLGFNSDVFEGKFDDDKYVGEMQEKHGATVDPVKQIKHEVSDLVKALPEEDRGDWVIEGKAFEANFTDPDQYMEAMEGLKKRLSDVQIPF